LIVRAAADVAGLVGREIVPGKRASGRHRQHDVVVVAGEALVADGCG
jgi:hypothetical protein